MNIAKPKAYRRRQSQHGFAFLQILAMLGMGAALLGVIGYGFVSLTKTSTTASARSQSADTLTQAKYTLTTEKQDYDGDTTYETVGMDRSASSCTTSTAVCPTGGGRIPSTSAAAKTDAWGTAIGYCAWDNGTTVTTTPANPPQPLANLVYLSGDNPATTSSVVFALISAGPDKTFNTTCVQARANTPQGDDGIRRMTVAEIMQGVGGTVYFGDPVATFASLPMTGNQVGVTRNVTGSNVTYVWTGSAWKPVTPMVSNVIENITVVENDVCSDTLVGALARNATGDLMICKP